MPVNRMALWVVLATSVVLSASMIVGGASAGTARSSISGADWEDQNNTTGSNYTVTFSETGLPSGTNWTVAVSITTWWFDDGGSVSNTSNSSSVTFSLMNGTYHFRVFPANGNDSIPERGTFTVNGTSPPPISVHFGVPTLYVVTFAEIGLANGTHWGVFLRSTNSTQGCRGWWDEDCGGSGDTSSGPSSSSDWHDHGGGRGYFNETNNASLTFEVPNGTYNFTVVGARGYSVMGSANGSVNVSGASPPPIKVTFSIVPVYAVMFVESGLPNGTNWSVDVSGYASFGGPWGLHDARHAHGHMRFQGTSSGTTITLNLTNGTYRFHVDWVDGFYSNQSRGRFNVSGGSPPPIRINFTAIPEFNVTFNESGLPGGTDWGVTVTGSTSHYAGSPSAHVVLTRAARGTVTFSLPHGHYHFSVLKLTGWRAKGGFPGHRFVLSDGPTAATIHFTSAGPRSSHGASPNVRLTTSALRWSGLNGGASPLMAGVER